MQDENTVLPEEPPLPHLAGTVAKKSPMVSTFSLLVSVICCLAVVCVLRFSLLPRRASLFLIVALVPVVILTLINSINGFLDLPKRSIQVDDEMKIQNSAKLEIKPGAQRSLREE